MVDGWSPTAVDCSEEALVKLEQLEAEHAIMLTSVKKRFKKGTSTKKFVECVSNFLQDVNVPLPPMGYNDAYRFLTQHVDTFNNHTLCCVARVLKNHQVLQLVHDYDKKKDNFLTDTTVRDFQRAVQHRAQSNREGALGNTVSLKLKGRWPDRTLKDIDYLVNNIFGIRSKAFLKPLYQDGCILVSWEVPCAMHCESELFLKESLHTHAAYLYVEDVDCVTWPGRTTRSAYSFHPKEVFLSEQVPFQPLLLNDDIPEFSSSTSSSSSSEEPIVLHRPTKTYNFRSRPSSASSRMPSEPTFTHQRCSSLSSLPLELECLSRHSSRASSIASSVSSILSIASLDL